jgi:hypothetical protein
VTPPACSVRALTLEDAAACDAIVASLPYHFGLAAGRAACARAVRGQRGLTGIVAGEVTGFLTRRPWTRRFYRRNGFDPVWEPDGWWDGRNQAVLMLRPL